MNFPNRAIISLKGPDTLALLERTVTHTVGDWQADGLRYGALLTPQGKVIADYLALRVADGVLVDVHADAAEDLMKRLKMFRLRSAVEIALDPGLAAMPSETGLSDPRGSALPLRTIGPAGGAVMPDAQWDALRVAAGVPEWGRDYRAAEVFPTDINMDVMGGVDYRKGCFVGQEVASRMKRRGKIRKRTARISGAGVATGLPVMAGAEIGTVTSAAPGGEGLALIRLDRFQKAMAEGAALTCNDQPATLHVPVWLDAELAALTEETGHD